MYHANSLMHRDSQIPCLAGLKLTMLNVDIVVFFAMLSQCPKDGSEAYHLPVSLDSILLDTFLPW